MFVDLILAAIVVLIIAIIATAVTHLWVGVPYVPTPRRIVERMVALAELKPGETVYDLGAGDARLLIAAKRKEPSLHAVGYELVPTVWILGKLAIWKSGQHVRFLMRDARRSDLRDADCIFVYLLPHLLRALLPKLNAELKPGARVISYVFRFPNKQPVHEERAQWLGEERSILVYRW